MNTYTNPYRTYNNEITLDRYIGLVGEAADLLAELTMYVGDHGDVAPDAVNETHVASMARIVQHLNAAKRQAGI